MKDMIFTLVPEVRSGMSEREDEPLELDEELEESFRRAAEAQRRDLPEMKPVDMPLECRSDMGQKMIQDVKERSQLMRMAYQALEMVDLHETAGPQVRCLFAELARSFPGWCKEAHQEAQEAESYLLLEVVRYFLARSGISRQVMKKFVLESLWESSQRAVDDRNRSPEERKAAAVVQSTLLGLWDTERFDIFMNTPI